MFYNYGKTNITTIIIIFTIFLGFETKTKELQEIIKVSIANNTEKCSYLHSFVCNGKKCVKKSAYYLKSEVFETICYGSKIKTNLQNVNQLIITKVIDGDTIYINKIKYRLYGIDAPEMKQVCQINNKNYNCGVKSKNFLVSLIGNEPVKCNYKDIDRYKRVVAECFVGSLNLNKELVRNGWALAYRDYSKDYVIDEMFARENNLGIWQGTFIHPKNWRKLNR